MNRPFRKLAGWIGIVAVVFAQLALSAYACPLLFQSLGESADSVGQWDVTSDVTSSSPDFMSSGLCKKHCENEQQSVNDSPHPLASVTNAPAFILALVANPPAPSASKALAPSLLHATSPPLSIRNCCFRI